MSQRAILDGEQSVLAVETNREVWVGLVAAHHAGRLTLPCCGAKAVPKENTYGTRYFSHAPYERIKCDWKPVSASHESAVAAATERGRTLGWTVKTEERGTNWRADVICHQPEFSVRLAIMIELRSRSDAAIDERGFEAEGIASFWLVAPRVDVHLPEGARTIVLPSSDYPAEVAASVQTLLQRVVQEFVTADRICVAVKGTDWAAEVYRWRGIPIRAELTKVSTGQIVPLGLNGRKIDLSFVKAEDGSERESEMVLQKELAELFRARLKEGIELWWPEYPVLAHDSFLALKAQIAEDQKRRAEFEILQPSERGFLKSAPEQQKAAYSSPKPAENYQELDTTSWAEQRVDHVRKVAEIRMTPEEAANWMDAPQEQLGGRSPREYAYVRSDVLQKCEIILGLRDAKTLKPLQ